MRRRFPALMIAAAAIIVAACGSDDNNTSDSAAPGASIAPAVTEAPGASEAPEATTAPGATSAPAASAPAGNLKTEISIALESEPRLLDAQKSQDGQMRRVAENINERLVDRDLNDPSKLVPRLAAELPTRETDTTWTVKIRPNITFTNGEPFDAAAAAAAITRELDPAYDSELLSQISAITKAEVVDPTTIRLTTAAPDPILPARLYMIQMVPPVASKAADYERNPVGTGPYKFVEWVAGDHIDLVANPDYWGTKPSIQNVHFRFLPENQTRVAALQAGEVDLAVAIAPESSADVPQLITKDGLEYPYLRLKNYEGILQKKEVRQAIAYAVDIDTYIDTIYGGNASNANCEPLGPSVFGYNPDLKPYPHDPDKAKELLTAAGYNNEEIRIIAPTGRWLKFEELSEAITNDLKSVGLNINMQLVQFDPWLTEFLVKIGEGQPDGALSSTSNEIQDADRLTSLIGRAGSVSSTVDDDLESKMTAARSTLDESVRQSLYSEIFKKVCDDAYLVPMLTFKDIYGASSNLTWTPRVDGTTRVEEMTLTA